MKLLSKKFLGSRSDLKSYGEKGKGKEEKLNKWLAARNFGGEPGYLVRNFRVFFLCSLLFKSSFISLFTFHIALTTTKVLWKWNFALLTVFCFSFFWEDGLWNTEYGFPGDTGWELSLIYEKSTKMSDINENGWSNPLGTTQNQLAK